MNIWQLSPSFSLEHYGVHFQPRFPLRWFMRVRVCVVSGKLLSRSYWPTHTHTRTLSYLPVLGEPHDELVKTKATHPAVDVKLLERGGGRPCSPAARFVCLIGCTCVPAATVIT